ncbi:MAG: anti-repressor SinI family protein [Bacillota bacterium]
MEKIQPFNLTNSKRFMDRDLDYEWVNLIQEALMMGITQEEIRHFLQFNVGINHKNH